MADSKLTALSEVSVPALDDVAYLADVSGAPDSVKVSINRLLGMLTHVCQGRLTLATGYPVYAPAAATPSATDTAADTTDFAAAHGWVTGTMVTVSATAGGLTAGTTYWINATDADTVSYHTTLAGAEAGTGKVNLTANVTGEVRPFGVQSTTLRYAPHAGNLISVYDGTRWKLYTFSELSVALGTLTSALPYDVFIYDNAGTLTLELLAWTSDTVRATALVQQDGVWCKTGALTRRYLGTIRTVSTTATEDSWGVTTITTSPKRFVWNMYNRVMLCATRIESNTSWTYTTNTVRQANGSTANQIELVCGQPINAFANLHTRAANSTTSIARSSGIGVDSTTVFHLSSNIARSGQAAAANETDCMTTSLSDAMSPGYHYISWLEVSTATGTCTWDGYNPNAIHCGLTAFFEG